jgi:hypothetical protein
VRVAPRVWRSVDADLFRFTTTELRDLHVALMAAFEEVAVLVPALNLDQVRSALVGIGWDEPLDDTADFDRGGLGVTAWLAQRAGTTPWHMTTLD